MAESGNGKDIIVLSGDSLTYKHDVERSFHQRMTDIYSDRYEVINRGYSGRDTSRALKMLDDVFTRQDEPQPIKPIKLITIWFGTKDCVLPPRPSHVPLKSFEANLHRILEIITSPSSPYAVADQAEKPAIVLITPGPICFFQVGPERANKRDQAVIVDYVQAVRNVFTVWKAKADKEGTEYAGLRLGLVDFWEAVTHAAGGLEDKRLKMFYQDGVHLSSEGYDVLWDSLSKVLVDLDFPPDRTT